MTRRLTDFVLFVLLLTPLFGLPEFLQNLGVDAPALAWLGDLRVFKDLLFAILFLAAFFTLAGRKVRKPILAFSLLLVFFAILGLINALFRNPLFVLGFRAFLPFGVIVFSYFYISRESINRIYRATKVVFFLLFLSLCVEYFFANNWGIGLLGFNQRACGFFFYPSPAAGFVVFFYWLRHRLARTYSLGLDLLVLASLFMISSAMGYIVFAMVFFLLRVRSRHYLATLLALVPLGYLFIFQIYPAMSGRDSFSTSFFTRIEILAQSILEGGLFGVAPGYGTNYFSRQFGPRLEVPEMVDNVFASLNWQYGTIASMLFLALIAYNLFREAMGRRGSKTYVDGLLITAIMGSSLSLLEFFPINLLLPLCIGFYYRESSPKQAYP